MHCAVDNGGSRRRKKVSEMPSDVTIPRRTFDSRVSATMPPGRRSDFAGNQSTFVVDFIQMITTAPKSFGFILDSYIYSMSLPQTTKTAATIRREILLVDSAKGDFGNVNHGGSCEHACVLSCTSAL